jgi:hypothetical protein
MVDGQRAGGTPAKAAAPDPHMGCVYVMRLWSGLLSTSSPLIHFPNLLAIPYSARELLAKVIIREVLVLALT